MEAKIDQIAKFFFQAQNGIKQIQKKQVQQLMAYHNLPNALKFQLRTFWALIYNQALDKVKEFVKVPNPSEPAQLDDKRIMYKFMQFFQGYESHNVYSFIKSFQPESISDQAYDFVLKQKAEFLEGPNPLVKENQIELQSPMRGNLWKWTSNMINIKLLVLKNPL